ncbi:MAG: ferritin-like domain-containing protein [Firmicutes bacterium]|nr:ferritin-like domain-containing protein [Bacillota bacterium]
MESTLSTLVGPRSSSITRILICVFTLRWQQYVVPWARQAKLSVGLSRTIESRPSSRAQKGASTPAPHFHATWCPEQGHGELSENDFRLDAGVSFLFGRDEQAKIGSVPPQQRQEILAGLNLDLSWEYAAMIQYIQHAAVLTGPEYTQVIEEELEHARDEHEHAVILADLINYLGGTPTVGVAERLTSEDNVEMLRQDLQAEYDAIARYLERIAQLESAGQYDSAQKIRNIVLVEQNHAINLEKALGIRRKSVAARM